MCSLGLLLAGLLQQVFIALIARLGFGLARLRRGRDPFLFALQGALMRGLLAAFLGQPLLFLREPGGVIALIGNAPATIQFENPSGDVVEEITVMGDDQDSARIIAQMTLQPRHRFSIEMVGRLVKQQQLRLIEQQAAKCDATAFATGQFCHVSIVRRTAQRVHRLVDLAIEIPQARRLDLVLQSGHLIGGVVRIIHRQFVIAIEDSLLLGDAQHDVFAHALVGFEMRLLLEIANPRALGDPRFPGIFLVDACHDPQQGRFSGAIDTEHADFRIGVERQMDVIEDLAIGRIGFGQTLHEIDELTGHTDAFEPEICWKFAAADVAAQPPKGNRVAMFSVRSPSMITETTPCLRWIRAFETFF